MSFPDVVFKVLSGPVVFVLLAVGLHFFLRGHNAPGGGFIAGLVVATAALLMRMAKGRRLLSVAPFSLVPLGLAIALLTGAVPLALGKPFLTSAHGHLELPLIGEVEWATAAVFDLGVFLVVVGTTLTIINLLAESREPLPPEPTVQEE